MKILLCKSCGCCSHTNIGDSFRCIGCCCFFGNGSNKNHFYNPCCGYIKTSITNASRSNNNEQCPVKIFWHASQLDLIPLMSFNAVAAIISICDSFSGVIEFGTINNTLKEICIPFESLLAITFIHLTPCRLSKHDIRAV